MTVLMVFVRDFHAQLRVHVLVRALVHVHVRVRAPVHVHVFHVLVLAHVHEFHALVPVRVHDLVHVFRAFHAFLDHAEQIKIQLYTLKLMI